MQTVHQYLAWFFVLLWMGVIFYLSHQSGNESGNLSSGISNTFLHGVQSLFPFIEIDEALFHHLIRKSAHFTAYFILGILVVHALGISKRIKAVFALIICAVYAASDEFHQLFIPGRGSDVRDVMIDSIGAAAGISIYILCMAVAGRIMKRK